MIDPRSPISRLTLVALAFTTAAGIGCGGSSKSARSPYAGMGYSSGSGGGHAAAEAAPAAEATGSGGEDGYAAPAAAAPSPASPGSPGGYAPSAPAAGGGYAPTAPVAKAPASTPPPTSAAPSADKAGEAAPMPPVKIETKTTVIVTPTPYPPPTPVPVEQESPTGGVLTAAIWDDHVYRPQFQAFLARYPQFQNLWGVDMSRRVTIRVEDSSGVAVGDAPLALRGPDGSVVNLRTHGDGNAYFWPNKSQLVYAQQQGATFAVAAQAGKLRKEAWFGIPATDATWTVRLDGVPARAQSPALDVAFVVDCTGSMGDEIAYLQNEVQGVVKRVKAEHAMRRVRLGLVLYRDRGDDFVTKSFGFTEDLGTYLSWIKTAHAMGGGDMPESVNAALADTVQKLDWAGDETGRLAILLADAPPHYYADEQYTYKHAIGDLNARGVKLVTVGASGIDKSTEYLFRQMSVYTGGRYVFLTDDSGVGDSHLVPDITGYQVEHLDKILVRVIGDEARAFKR
ncbi:MAG: VWA domain-containing protein [Deltaproteobacteria bacterium]|nr:VWA domain-containing protein [Deltaproteobacteria bacterium]